jgi:hypothetical protein
MTETDAKFRSSKGGSASSRSITRIIGVTTSLSQAGNAAQLVAVSASQSSTTVLSNVDNVFYAYSSNSQDMRIQLIMIARM